MASDIGDRLQMSFKVDHFDMYLKGQSFLKGKHLLLYMTSSMIHMSFKLSHLAITFDMYWNGQILKNNRQTQLDMNKGL